MANVIKYYTTQSYNIKRPFSITAPIVIGNAFLSNHRGLIRIFLLHTKYFSSLSLHKYCGQLHTNCLAKHL